MNYTNESVRRQDRLLEEEKALFLLEQGEYGILSLQAEDGGGYGIPLNYAWDGATSIYLHCAPEGRKLRCLSQCNRVSFCVIGHTHVISRKFSMEYESVLLQCTAQTGLSPEEKMQALTLLLRKYSPDDMEAGKKYARNSFPRTEIIRLEIGSWSGKTKSSL